MKAMTWGRPVRLAFFIAVALINVHAYGQWSRNTATNPPTLSPTNLTDNVAIGTSTADPSSRLTIAGGETFRFTPNPVVRLLEFDFNHYVGATQSRNGAAMRIDLRWGPPDNFPVPAFCWFIRAANEPLPAGLETQKMYLDKDGNLAIGFNGMSGNTTDKLQVNGAARLNGKALLLDLPKRQKTSRLEVITPQAIAAVRGTKWAVDVQGGKTSVFVVRGQVDVRRSTEGSEYAAQVWPHHAERVRRARPRGGHRPLGTRHARRPVLRFRPRPFHGDLFPRQAHADRHERRDRLLGRPADRADLSA